MLEANDELMTGQPPTGPPKLSYKSRAEREKEEREREEREREERERKELEERERAERELETLARRRAEAARSERQRRREERLLEERALGTAPARPGEPETARESPALPDRDLAMFEEDALGITPEEREHIEMLGAPEEPEEAEETVGEVPEEVPAPRRRPPRPPRSPDMRPVWAGFILVSTGLAQLTWGLLAMWASPGFASGNWSPLLRVGAFSMGFIAAFLGLLAVRGGLWSFRKERFGIVKVGAIAATVCVWAWWVPWLLGALALLIVHRARSEYYPFYDPRWDAPSWAPPPPTAMEVPDERARAGEDGEEGPVDEGEDEGWELARSPTAVPTGDGREGATTVKAEGELGPQEAVIRRGDGWEDLA